MVVMSVLWLLPPLVLIISTKIIVARRAYVGFLVLVAMHRLYATMLRRLLLLLFPPLLGGGQEGA